MADERIEHLSEKLHLPDVPALLGALAQEAVAKEWCFSGFTEVLLQAQADAADARAADTIQRLAGFTVRKTLDEFDYSFQPSVNKKQVAELASCAFVERAENVVLLGPPGVGKTHLAIALGAEAAKRRMQVEFTTAARFVASLSEARTAGTFSRRLQSFVRPRLLIVDEVGFLPLDAGEASLLFEVVCRRYERGSIVLTSNKRGSVTNRRGGVNFTSSLTRLASLHAPVFGNISTTVKRFPMIDRVPVSGPVVRPCIASRPKGSAQAGMGS